MDIVLSTDIVKVCLMIFMDTTDVLCARVYTREIVLVYLHLEYSSHEMFSSCYWKSLNIKPTASLKGAFRQQ